VRFPGHRGGYRRDAERQSFAFFIVGAIVVIAVTFFIGLQVGRVLEKDAAEKDRAAGGSPARVPGADNGARGAESADIRKELSAFSEDASRVPPVPAPPSPPASAGEDLRQTERSATFPETLSRKDAAPQPLVAAGGKTGEPGGGDGPYSLQAGAMRNRETADAVRRRLAAAGYKAKVAPGKDRTGGQVYRIRVGPFDSRDAARKAMNAIRTQMKLDVILVKG
jgi:cell division protein FtsN